MSSGGYNNTIVIIFLSSECSYLHNNFCRRVCWKVRYNIITGGEGVKKINALSLWSDTTTRWEITKFLSLSTPLIHSDGFLRINFVNCRLGSKWTIDSLHEGNQSWCNSCNCKTPDSSRSSSTSKAMMNEPDLVVFRVVLREKRSVLNWRQSVSSSSSRSFGTIHSFIYSKYNFPSPADRTSECIKFSENLLSLFSSHSLHHREVRNGLCQGIWKEKSILSSYWSYWRRTFVSSLRNHEEQQ